MSKFSKQKIDPCVLFKQWSWEVPHITFNPNLKRSNADFSRVQGGSHDGTMIFSLEILQKCLIPLANKESFAIDRPIPANIKDIHYEIGWIKLSSVFGMVNIPAGRYPGMRERARVAVKCEYICDES